MCCTGWNSKWLCNQWPKDNSCALFRGQSNFTHFFSNSAAERGHTWGRGASQRCMVTAVRIRQSDCRLSKCDVTYPSAGILLLPFSSGPGRGKKKKRKSHGNILWDHYSAASHTRDWAPDASSYPYTNAQTGGGEQLWSTCGHGKVRYMATAQRGTATVPIRRQFKNLYCTNDRSMNRYILYHTLVSMTVLTKGWAYPVDASVSRVVE